MVRIRPFEKDDARIIAEKINHFETLVGIGRILPLSISEEEKFVEHAIQETIARRSIFYAIEEILESQIVGSVSLNAIDSRNRTAELGVVIFEPKNFNKGYGTEAVTLSLHVGFNIMNLNRIELNVYEFNSKAKHVYEQVGFKEIGRRRQYFYYGGKFYDSFIMDMLSHEYFEKFGEKEAPNI